MKNSRLPKNSSNRNKGIALILVVAVLSLLTVLTVAMFSVSETERSTSSMQVDQEQSRELADTAINIVMGQIWQGTKQDPNTAGRELWASQPGAIRKYTNDGTFHSGYKMYSSRTMVVKGGTAALEQGMITDTPPNNWNTMPARYVDMNEPVIRPPVTGSTVPTAYFPIIDPRAYLPLWEGRLGDSNPNVEGFYYNSAIGMAGLTAATSVTDANARLPMPVEWLYVLKDGTIGALNTANQFTKPDGNILTDADAATNPIVGRFAMWTDDESCKLNINTASEPTYWTTPSLFHDRDLWWAFYQPMTNEYQRYPGHPATVALSTVFFPNQDMDIYGKTKSTDESSPYGKILKKKETIYSLAPKVNTGGSRVGTQAYWTFVDNYTGYKTAQYNQYVDLTNSMKERLYASVDELYFSQQFNGGTTKTRASTLYSKIDDSQDSGNPFFVAPDGSALTAAYNPDHPILERLRFFLTAHSRMPEVNMFGTPRVAIWPVADESGIFYQEPTGTISRTKYRGQLSDYRTGYDQLIAFCSSLGTSGTANNYANSYFFRRKCAYDKSTDINISRNMALFKYLSSLLQQKLPGGASFAQKYPNDYQQILLEIFDYIRSTNLYDGYLAPTKDQQQVSTGEYSFNNGKFGNGTNEVSNDGNIYRNRPVDFRTFTYDRASSSQTRGGSSAPDPEQQTNYSFPGHCMVVPSQMGGLMGFGRFLTITECGFQFICTADGKLDKGSFRADDSMGKKRSGGRTAMKIVRHTGGGFGQSQSTAGSTFDHSDAHLNVWYSNFPPYPSLTTMQDVYGVDPRETNTSKPSYPANHPGCIPANWNATLDRDKPLKETERRIQGMFIMNLSMPAPGMGGLNPEFAISVEGLNKMQVSDSGGHVYQLYDSGDNLIIWKSQNSIYDSNNCRPVGGCVSIAGMTVGRRIGAHGQQGLDSDVGYDSTANTGGDPHRGTKNFDLTTTFFSVTPDGSGNMQFVGGPLVMKLYSSHLINDNTLCQTFHVTMPSRTVPVPQLVTISSDHEQWQNSDGTIDWEEAVDAPHWWCLNFSGALNRYAGSWNPRSGGWGSVALTAPSTSNATDIRTMGRFYTNSNGKTRVSVPKGNGNANDQVPRGGNMIWAYIPADGNYNSPLLNPSNPGADTPTVSGMTSQTYKTDSYPENGGVGGAGNRDSRGQDTVFTMVTNAGDWRMVAASPVYDDWVPHPRDQFLTQNVPGPGGGTSFTQFVAHSMSRYYSSQDSGYDRGTAQYRLVQNAGYNSAKIPDVPSKDTFCQAAWKYGDFDNGGFGGNGLRDGAYINKPDEGDGTLTFHAFGTNSSQTVRLPNAYLSTYDYGWLYNDPGMSYMSPNRLVSSPGMFGSLSTGVKSGVPWRTLLFRPQTIPPGSVATGLVPHTGAAKYQGGVDPADHYIMDLFWMPIVEPYAISEPFSTAGKININYQMVPFNNYIRRATGVHAVMKGEMIKAIPFSDAGNYNQMPGTTKDIDTSDGYHYRQPWTDVSANRVTGVNMKVWHRNIETEKRVGTSVTGTLQYFEERFNHKPDLDFTGRPNGLFRTASQICEVPLIPRKITGVGDGDDTTYGNISTAFSQNQLSSQFWADRRMTGDNTKERPYANIYGKICTQSNTFRVHFRTQVLRKARSTNASTFDPNKDSVLTDYRGSALIERRIDPSDTRIPDYGNSTNPVSLQPLDDFYQFRVLEVKRFNP